MSVVVVFTVQNGLGKDIWTLTPEKINEFFKLFYIGGHFYGFTFMFANTNFLFFYLRLFADERITFVSILRLSSIRDFMKTSNPTWDIVPIPNWSFVELNGFIFCSCMPAFRDYFRRLFVRRRLTIQGVNSVFGARARMRTVGNSVVQLGDRLHELISIDNDDDEPDHSLRDISHVDRGIGHLSTGVLAAERVESKPKARAAQSSTRDREPDQQPKEVDLGDLKHLAPWVSEGTRNFLFLGRYPPALETLEEHENDYSGVSNAGTPRDTYCVAFMFDNEVESYVPERWLGDKGKELQLYFVSFSAGARGCIGRNISYLEQTVLLTNVLHRYNFALPFPEWEPERRKAMNLMPSPMPLKVWRRELKPEE
ncbi:cytochrome P450 oxidoreductase [Colletotrichum salicis]|uniref:Cytochrome P450 oxidoreductase n=1 Tax=Colletotrichum salicis TaxID=1209931 RepID=A0A135U5D0_9PEZI|nr:cytochrome P450 oxidoreductase [Colletotrichum salicis]